MYLTHNELKKRKRIKRRLYVLLSISLLWISFGIYLTLTSRDKKKLENIGYSNIEINIINDLFEYDKKEAL